MDDKQADALAVLLSNEHATHFKTLNSQPKLKKFSVFKETRVAATRGTISFFDGSPQTLRGQLKAFMFSPKRECCTPYMIVDIDSKCGWLKLMRFVGNKHAELNTETICLLLSGDDNDVNSFGFRFEHPERFPGNKHGFFHVQPIISNSTDSPFPGCITWLPVHFPTFYMFASSAFELTIFSIHSLAGWELLSEFQRKHREDNGVLKHLIRVGDSSRVPYPFGAIA
ncbi:hypothetical protein [Pseudomonas fluorescens]|uniref:Uncharacterized protein n=1 Tax=Pseudomonas fluorescens TaxID=294 RepID=A0A4Y9TKY8_PSEFL|nr:hypothetical protein [Pseudomonas fluorescens]TFW43139.1 hypothetical protein E4T65_12300 [Pseudomonas fluorescens]